MMRPVIALVIMLLAASLMFGCGQKEEPETGKTPVEEKTAEMADTTRMDTAMMDTGMADTAMMDTTGHSGY